MYVREAHASPSSSVTVPRLPLRPPGTNKNMPSIGVGHAWRTYIYTLPQPPKESYFQSAGTVLEGLTSLSRIEERQKHSGEHRD